MHILCYWHFLIIFKSLCFLQWCPIFDSSPLIQNSKFSYGYVDSYAKIFLILYPPFENSTTRIAIMYIHMKWLEISYFSQNETFLCKYETVWRPSCDINFCQVKGKKLNDDVWILSLPPTTSLSTLIEKILDLVWLLRYGFFKKSLLYQSTSEQSE